MNLKPYFIALITILMLGCNESTNNSTREIAPGIGLTAHKNAKTTLTVRSLDESTKTSYFLHSKYGMEEILIDSNQFKVTLDHDFSMIVNLSIDYNVTYPIFISPGDSIHLEYNEMDLLNNFKLSTVQKP